VTSRYRTKKEFPKIKPAAEYGIFRAKGGNDPTPELAINFIFPIDSFPFL